jgi:hypothetical protein
MSRELATVSRRGTDLFHDRPPSPERNTPRSAFGRTHAPSPRRILCPGRAWIDDHLRDLLRVVEASAASAGSVGRPVHASRTSGLRAAATRRRPRRSRCGPTGRGRMRRRDVARPSVMLCRLALVVFHTPPLTAPNQTRAAGSPATARRGRRERTHEPPPHREAADVAEGSVYSALEYACARFRARVPRRTASLDVERPRCSWGAVRDGDSGGAGS